MRKKWEAKTEITPELLSFREKRKWQINLRRYVLEKSPSPFYAPYFGLDINGIRQWFQDQFTPELNWENFGKQWQFDHIIPLTYFDHGQESELRLCWNFTNLRVEPLEASKNSGNRIGLLGAKGYFEELYKNTGYRIPMLLAEKISQIALSEFQNTSSQQQFVLQNKEYIQQIQDYSSFEFELLNRGRSVEEVKKEILLITNNQG